MTELLERNLTTRDVEIGDGTVLHVNEAGDPGGPPVLWLHGSGPGATALSNWEHLITRTFTSFRNIAPDMLGFGDSTHPDPSPRGLTASTAVRATATVALLDALGLEKVHVVGNSMGGMVALGALLAAPHRFERVVLMGSGGAPGRPSTRLGRMARFYDDPTPANMRLLMEDFLVDPAAFAGDLDAIAATRTAKAVRPDVRRSFEATFDPEGGPLLYSPEALATIRHDVLLMHGRDDEIVPLDRSLYFLEHIDRARLHVVPRAGHWMQLERPQEFAVQVALFLT